jgi:excinuclease ABC subunit B
MVEVRPIEGQIDDLIGEINKRAARDERVLVTTLTKKMAEDLTVYLQKAGIRVRYMHSDIGAMERMEIIRDLRMAKFDVLIGINLLREGLDLPEVSLVAILDADKEGFLRDHRSLTQTAGRAARHVNGKVIMYADRITRSMRITIDETLRRRTKQMAYNEAHNITPTALNKKIEGSPLIALMRKEQEEQQVLEQKIKEGWKVAAWQQYDAKTLRKAIEKQRKAMLAAAKELNFDVAAHLRDELLQMEDKLQAIE